MKALLQKRDKIFYLAGLLFLVGCAARLVALTSLPNGLNQDEAYAGYNAWCILHYGVDSAGYRNPVYLNAWGSGMNVLETYLMIPFMALLGPTTLAMRLPQALVACLSLFCIYDLGKRTLDRGFGLCALAVLATSPWHVMMSRWALESNLAPGFLLFGLYFFVRGMSSPKWLYASAAAYGLGLYAYATIWPIMPVILVLQGVYALRVKSVRVRDLIGPALLVLALAIPLLLFLAVQMDFLPEVRTAFLSIPKLEKFRSGDLSLSRIPENIRRVALILLQQRDNAPWNYHSVMGLYYPFWLLPFAIGLGAVCVRTVRCLRERKSGFEGLVLINLLAGGLQCCVILVNVNRMNAVHIPILLCVAYGVYTICAGVRAQLRRQVRVAVAATYALCFMLFIGMYASSYNDVISTTFRAGLREALAHAQSVRGSTPMHISDEGYGSQIYFFLEKPPLEELPDDITIGDLSDLPEDAVYVGTAEEVAELAGQGYELTRFDEWAVALPSPQ